MSGDDFFTSWMAWKPAHRRVNLPSAAELEQIIRDYETDGGRWGVHRSTHAYYTWYHAYVNGGVVPTGVTSVFQSAAMMERMFSPALIDIIIEGGRERLDYTTPEALMESPAFLTLVRISLAFRLIEFADSPPWFSFSESLVYSLMASDIGRAKRGITLPYPAVVFEYPDGILRMKADGVEFSFRAVTVATENAWMTASEGQQRQAFLVSAMLSPVDRKNYGVVNLPHFVIAGAEEEVDGERCVSAPTFGTEPRLCSDMKPDWLRIGGRDVDQSEFVTMMDKITWLSILYLCADNDAKLVDRTPKRRRKKGKKGKKGIPQARKRQWALGEEYVLGSTVKAHPLIKQAALDGITSVPASVAYAHVVKGHFKLQPCGPRRLDRKRIWVQPYVRNTEAGGPVVGHTYQVD